jgi:hypothetical protein
MILAYPSSIRLRERGLKDLCGEIVIQSPRVSQASRADVSDALISEPELLKDASSMPSDAHC